MAEDVTEKSDFPWHGDFF